MVDDAAKPWAGNRVGDPRQLLHEATHLEALAFDRRREALRLRKLANVEEEAAIRMEEAARDYRRWAAARGVLV
jgi:hypothetical protein